MKRSASKNRGGILMAGTTLAIAALLLATPVEAGREHGRNKPRDDRHVGNPHRPQGQRHNVHSVLQPQRHRPWRPRHHIVEVPRRDHQHSQHYRIEVPTRIHSHHHVSTYRSYYNGRAWFRPHRHYHTVYHFPVRTVDGWFSQPHYYCGSTACRRRHPGRRAH